MLGSLSRARTYSKYLQYLQSGLATQGEASSPWVKNASSLELQVRPAKEGQCTPACF